jgi:hypothetical protein
MRKLGWSESLAVNLVLEFLGVGIYLLCPVGSWRDIMSDREVMDELRAWNEVEGKR